MALHRGIQSAIFYYLSCAPCTDYSYRKKRRKEATRDREARNALEEELPGLYRHPSPFATNPNWQTEIELGPSHGPSGKKKKDKNERTVAEQLGLATSSSLDDGSRVGSAADLNALETRNDSRLNMRRHQREDEELWGKQSIDTQMRRSRTGTGSSTGLSRPPTARTTRTDKSAVSYHAPNNPDINELHPATVTRIDQKQDAMWMLQPPPAAKVMLGKERVSRSRSDSGGSRHSSRQGTDDRLSRQLTARLYEEKMKSRDTLEPPIPPSMSRKSSYQSKRSNGSGRRPRRSVPYEEEAISSSSDESLAPRRRRPKAQVSQGVTSAPSIAPLPTHIGSKGLKAAPASNLPTIFSTSPSPRGHARKRSQTHATPPRLMDPPSIVLQRPDRISDRQPALVTKDKSLNVLQELVPNTSMLAISKRKSASDLDSPPRIEDRPAVRQQSISFATPRSATFSARRVSLPRTDSAEEQDLQNIGPEFDAWMKANKDMDPGWFTQWAADRVTREVSHRWSMDL